MVRQWPIRHASPGPEQHKKTAVSRGSYKRVLSIVG